MDSTSYLHTIYITVLYLLYTRSYKLVISRRYGYKIQINELESRFSLIYKSFPDGLLILDEGLQIQLFNSNFLSLMHCNSSEIIQNLSNLQCKNVQCKNLIKEIENSFTIHSEKEIAVFGINDIGLNIKFTLTHGV